MAITIPCSTPTIATPKSAVRHSTNSERRTCQSQRMVERSKSAVPATITMAASDACGR